jgi:hypothetical protein
MKEWSFGDPTWLSLLVQRRGIPTTQFARASCPMFSRSCKKGTSKSCVLRRFHDTEGQYRVIQKYIDSRFKLASFNACVLAGLAKTVAAVEIIDGKVWHMSRATALKNDVNSARHPLTREDATGWLPPNLNQFIRSWWPGGKYW